MAWRTAPVQRRVAGILAAVAVVAVSFGVAGPGWPSPEATPASPEITAGRALPALPALTQHFEGVLLASYLEPPAVTDAHMDDLLRSPVLHDPDFARAVHAWVRYWTGPAAGWFPGFLERMAWLGSTVDSALLARELPQSMRYLPLIESGYAPGVTSSASAVGLWQLMPGTARDLGLEVTPLLDERRDPERSTDAALRFLEGLHGNFGSWFVTLAAYNSGPARVRGILRKHAPGEPLTDSLLWALREHLPAETREFLPKLYGAMWVASRPEAYGFEIPAPDAFVFDVVSVPDQTTLDVVGLAAGVPYAEIVRLNPEFPRWITPPDREVTLRVPKGSGRTFQRIYPRIRPQDRVTFLEHEVRSGETLSQIADRYGVGLQDIEEANPRVRARSLGVGVRLVVPVAPSLVDEPVS